jgi:VCBS repeat-containing protein
MPSLSIGFCIAETRGTVATCNTATKRNGLSHFLFSDVTHEISIKRRCVPGTGFAHHVPAAVGPLTCETDYFGTIHYRVKQPDFVRHCYAVFTLISVWKLNENKYCCSERLRKPTWLHSVTVPFFQLFDSHQDWTAAMANTNSTSFTKTPQAKDDIYSWTEDDLLGQDVMTFEVMANDLGGNAKSLYSLAGEKSNASGANNALLAADTNNGVSGWEQTSAGNWARINNGQIEFKLGASLTGIGATSLNALSASHTISDEFVYAIRLGNGTLSQGRAVINIQGQNDGPVAVSDSAIAIEASGINNATLGVNPTGNVLGNDTDVDVGDTKSVVSTGSFVGEFGTMNLAADGSYTYVVNNALAAVQALNTDSTPLRDIFSYTMTDASGATSTAQLEVLTQGANDAATITGNASGQVAEDSTLIATGSLLVTDVDSLQSFRPQTDVAGEYGRFTIDASGNWQFTLDNTAANVQALNTGDKVTDSFTVTSHDGTATQTVSVDIAGLNDNSAPVAVNDFVAGQFSAGVTLTFEGGTYNYEYNYDNGYYYYGYNIVTNEGFRISTDNSYYGVGVTGYWGADYSNAVYSYSNSYYGSSLTTTPLALTKVDGSSFSLQSANITALVENYYYGGYTNNNPVETITGYYQGTQVAQTQVTVPSSDYYGNSTRNNVVTLAGDAWQQVDKVVFSMTNTNTNNYNYYDYYNYYYYYNYTYQFIDNVKVRDTAASALDINVLANDFDVDAGALISVSSFSATSAHGAAISMNANGTLHYDPTASADLLAQADNGNVYDTFTYQTVDQYGAVSNVATVNITLVGTQEGIAG